MVIGGGEVAARKVEGLLRCGARVSVIALELTESLRKLAETHEIKHRARAYERGDLRGSHLVIAATDNEAVNREIAAEAEELDALLNVVNVPELCTFIAPAVLERGGLQVAVSTAGAAPSLAANVRDRLSEVVGPEYAAVVRVVKAVRELLRREGRAVPERERILKELAASSLPEQVRGRDCEGIDRLLGEIVGGGVTLANLGVSLD